MPYRRVKPEAPLATDGGTSEGILTTTFCAASSGSGSVSRS